MHSKESMEVEEMVEAGILLPPDEEKKHREESVLLTQPFDEWKEDLDREPGEKGDQQ